MCLECLECLGVLGIGNINIIDNLFRSWDLVFSNLLSRRVSMEPSGGSCAVSLRPAGGWRQLWVEADGGGAETRYRAMRCCRVYSRVYSRV
jgi:hypothetical protein